MPIDTPLLAQFEKQRGKQVVVIMMQCPFREKSLSSPSQTPVSPKYLPHFGGNCGPYHETEPYNFAYGKSKYISTEDIPKILNTRLEQVMRPWNRTQRERDENIPRNIVFLTWAPELEMCTLERFGLD